MSVEGVNFRECNNHLFEQDMGRYVVYTDGSCTNNGYYGAQAGIGVFWGIHLQEINLSQPVFGDKHSNNVAELQAASEAIQQAQWMDIDRLEVRTDSMYVFNCMTKWVYQWKNNGWRNIDGNTVLNIEEVMRLDELRSCGVRVWFTHVPGHAGILGNQMANDLAVRGRMR